MVSPTEVTLLRKLLAKDWDEAWVSDSKWSPDLGPSPKPEWIAKQILNDLEAHRQREAKFINVSRIKLPNGEWHNFALGPFKTLLQAQRAGERMTHDPKTGTGEGFYRAVPIVENPAEAWNYIRPEQVDNKAWLKEQIQTGLTGLSDPDVYKNRSKW